MTKPVVQMLHTVVQGYPTLELQPNLNFAHMYPVKYTLVPGAHSTYWTKEPCTVLGSPPTRSCNVSPSDNLPGPRMLRPGELSAPGHEHIGCCVHLASLPSVLSLGCEEVCYRSLYKERLGQAVLAVLACSYQSCSCRSCCQMDEEPGLSLGLRILSPHSPLLRHGCAFDYQPRLGLSVLKIHPVQIACS